MFENNTGKSNVQEFETRINNILNEANAKAGKIGKESLSSLVGVAAFTTAQERPAHALNSDVRNLRAPTRAGS